MKYALLIYWDEKEAAAAEPGLVSEVMESCYRHNQGLAKEKIFLEGAPLAPTSEAKTVRIRDGERIVSDGPFAETKEQLGGYTLLDCMDGEHAERVSRETLERQRNHAGGIALYRLGGDA